MKNQNLLAASALMLVSVASHAALPTEAAAAFTVLSTNVTDIFTAVWPIVGVVVGGFVLIKLFKKGAGAI